jgi:hypothetical protein
VDRSIGRTRLSDSTMDQSRRDAAPLPAALGKALRHQARGSLSARARLIRAACPARRAAYEVAKVDQVTVAAWLARRRAALRKLMSASKHRVDDLV